MKTQRNCGNCHYYNSALEVSGECSAPVPASLRHIPLGRRVMFDTAGTNCPAHRMKAVRKAAAQLEKVA